MWLGKCIIKYFLCLIKYFVLFVAGCRDRSRLWRCGSLLADPADAEGDGQRSEAADHEPGSEEAGEGDQGGAGGDERGRGHQDAAAHGAPGHARRGAEEGAPDPGEARGVHQGFERGSSRLMMRKNRSFYWMSVSCIVISSVTARELSSEFSITTLSKCARVVRKLMFSVFYVLADIFSDTSSYLFRFLTEEHSKRKLTHIILR